MALVVEDPQLAHQVAELVHDEFALVQAEMSEKGKRAGRSAGMLGGAGLFGLAAFTAEWVRFRDSVDTLLETGALR